MIVSKTLQYTNGGSASGGLVREALGALVALALFDLEREVQRADREVHCLRVQATHLKQSPFGSDNTMRQTF